MRATSSEKVLHQPGRLGRAASAQHRLRLRGLRALAAMRVVTKRSLHREGGSARPRWKTDQASRPARLLRVRHNADGFMSRYSRSGDYLLVTSASASGSHSSTSFEANPR